MSRGRTKAPTQRRPRAAAEINRNTWEHEALNRPAWRARLQDEPGLVEDQRDIIDRHRRYALVIPTVQAQSSSIMKDSQCKALWSKHCDQNTMIKTLVKTLWSNHCSQNIVVKTLWSKHCGQNTVVKTLVKTMWSKHCGILLKFVEVVLFCQFGHQFGTWTFPVCKCVIPGAIALILPSNVVSRGVHFCV